LKARGLITTPSHILLAAGNEFSQKTCFVHEMWQTDFTYFKILGWGWYYLSTVLDDHSRYIVHWELCKTMKTQDVQRTITRAKADGSAIRDLAKIERQDLLILDDFGIQPFDQTSRASLLEIIEDRHGKRPTIITSQLPIKQWHEVIGEKTVANAILDIIINKTQRIELKGESLRKKWNKKQKTTTNKINLFDAAYGP
jgi:DNA replication protein DnaC